MMREYVDLVLINSFRELLPPHRQLWFDALSLADQMLLAEDHADERDYRESLETQGGPGA